MDRRADDASGRRKDPTVRLTHLNILILALLPWACLAFSRDWIYSASGMIDPWLYHGYFHRLPEFVSTLYPGTYYGTRLAWLLPGYAAYAMFPPHVANIALHVGRYYVAIGGLYRTVAVLADRSSALAAAVAFGTFWQVLIALGFDYVDGAVIAYWSLALACFVSAATSKSPLLYLAAAGAASAAMVHSNLGAALMVPSGAISYAVLRGHATRRGLAAQVCAWLAGGVALTAVLAAANVWAGGRWLFFLPSVNWTLASLGTRTYVPAPLTALPVLTQLMVPSLAVVIAMGLVMVRRTGLAVAAAAPMLFGSLVFVLYDWIETGGLLQTQYYVSWLLLPAFVVMGAALSPLTGPHAVWRVGAFVGLVCLANWFVAPRLGFHGDSNSRSQFDLVQQTIQFVSTQVPIARGRPLFWVEQGPSTPFVSSLVSTHLFLYSLLGANYPVLPEDAMKAPRNGATLSPGSTVVVVSYGPPDSIAMEREFARFGMTAHLGASARIYADRVKLVLSVVDVGASSQER